MERYTIEQCVFIIEQYFKNNESLATAVRKFHTKYQSECDNPGTSIRRRGQELQISRSSLQRILTKDLCLHAYKIQLTQQLKPNDHTQRREFVEWIIEHQQMDADFSSKIILSDEAHFHLDGFVNRQNCRFWGTENPFEMPHMIKEGVKDLRKLTNNASRYFHALQAVDKNANNSEESKSANAPSVATHTSTIANNNVLLFIALIYVIIYTGEFQNLFLNLQTNYRHAIILGDFNANMLNLRNSSTLLDLCIIDDSIKLVSLASQHDMAFLSAHDLISIRYKIKIQRRSDRLVMCRNFKYFNEEIFLSEVQSLDWSSLFQASSIKRKIDILNSRLFACYNKHALLQRIQYKNVPYRSLLTGFRIAI
ncbi:hypothetical protein ALC56_14968 [Trachymyrmex septentrionalis]|uniref:Uncharacterized protein n=1 Tax=Trachymyrmex septentrionalis TaxID=34720 RepID=A0A151JSZ5_9HYME|nr:hypothetical protein ALC56_14968 [Trachymyrmex septentrionalis]